MEKVRSSPRRYSDAALMRLVTEGEGEDPSFSVGRGSDTLWLAPAEISRPSGVVECLT